MRNKLLLYLQEIGDHSSIEQLTPVSGGSINQAYYCLTKDQKYFFKTNQGCPADFFRKEAEGLSLLRQTKTIGVPEVYGQWYDPAADQVYLISEWIEPQDKAPLERELGRGLAHLHLQQGKQCGLDADNYLGQFPQINGWSDDWCAFYRDNRLRVQVELGANLGYIEGKRWQRFELLLQKLKQWIPHTVEPALLHGDLWSGNWLAGADGQPYLIDPAVFYGDREMDLAMTELFGGFGKAFYEGYEEVYPLSALYAERKPLYQLYYLLLHLNHYGESYGQRIDEWLRRLV